MSATAAPEVETKKGGKKKLILAAVVVLIAAGAGGWFSGIIPKMLHKEEALHAEAEKGPPAPTFVELPDIVANLNTGGRRAAYIKLKAKLELARADDQVAIQAAMPRVLDLFQGYLREMRPEELRSSAATYRLREELISRTNIAASPAHVVNVLFVELLVQ